MQKNNNTKYLTTSTQSVIHENYWFQDLSGTIFNLDYAIKIIPNSDMTYPEKINSLVRLSIYIGVILALFYSNFLFLYVPILTMLMTYILYLFRIDQLDETLKIQGPNTQLSDLSNSTKDNLMNKLMGNKSLNNSNSNSNRNNSLEDVLNISSCIAPTNNNPFMNPLLFDSRTRDSACDVIKPENQISIEKEYNSYCIKDVSDIWNHNSGRRQFYTVANTKFPNDQGGFANWLYRTPPTCKEGSGAQCVANVPYRINGSLITPSFAQ